ncbi:MAG: cholesterol esterase [Pleopsidium flavum]|nr:MAG: cholesterol esterase [Pleopsidium flavum]
MARVPFIGRLFWREYLALFGSFILIFLEIFIRIITLGLPHPIIRFFYNRSKSLFNLLSSPQGRRSRIKEKSVVSSIANSSDFVDLCAFFGYYAEEHIVQTGDGYLLGLHRLGWRQGEEGMRVNAGEGSVKKPVIYLHHGLLMNSEVWVCLTEAERCLPFALVDKGYDVWFGNNRGNKYSKKSTRFSPTSRAFWNFSMDQFAFHDIPDSIDYILSTTSQPSLSYIGFSQGTAQAFATLSIHPTLNDKVDVFIALAPAMSPAGLHNGVVHALTKSSPQVIFLAFGRRSILSSATMWQAVLYPPIFVRIIDMSLKLLFNWTARNISPDQKLAAYPHLYSFTSTKSVVHWFQIIRNKSFQMYDDDVQVPLSIGAGERYWKAPKFPTRNIKTPIVLVYGGSDSLVDIKVMLKELPKHTIAKEIPHFEHLDFLWARDVQKLVFPHVFEALDDYAQRELPKGRLLTYNTGRNIPLTITHPPSYSEDERSALTTPGGASDTTADGQTNGTTAKSYAAAARDRSSPSIAHANFANRLTPDNVTARPYSPSSASPGSLDGATDSATPTRASRIPIAPQKRKHSRSNSLDSNASLTKFEKGGISLGTSKATVGGVIANTGHGVELGDSGGGGRK